MKTKYVALLISTLLAIPGASWALDAGAADEVTNQLLAADRAFSAQSEREDAARAFAAFAAPEALEFAPNSDPLRGAERIGAAMKNLKGKLSWTPTEAHAGASGDIGYTWGHFEYLGVGAKEIETGTYVTIWRRQPDGAWKFVVDIGNDGKPRPLN